MIERKTGFVNLSSTIQLKPGRLLDYVTDLQLGEVQKMTDMQTGWKWLTVKNVKVEESYFIFSLGFYTNALKRIDLIRSNDRFDLEDNWQAWSEENERKILIDLRTWLYAELGREGAFDWGEARAVYDPKGGSSLIHISYK